jgi:hypothetical protein
MVDIWYKFLQSSRSGGSVHVEASQMAEVCGTTTIQLLLSR